MAIGKWVLGAALAAGTFVTQQAVQADVVAYWAFNAQNLPNGGLFGFEPGDFPQAADLGSGSLTMASFDTTTEVDGSGNTKYATIESFAGNTLNAQPSVVAGGSLSPEGIVNNGAQIIVEVDLSQFEAITVSWAQRGTSTGYTSRDFAWSIDGTNYTTVSYTGESGALTSTWTAPSIDLSAVGAIEGDSSVFFRITLGGASGTSGNNRFDNITVTGTPIPEPASLALAGAGLLMMARRRRSV